MNPDSWRDKGGYIGAAIFALAVFAIFFWYLPTQNINEEQAASDETPMTEKEEILQALSASRTTSMTPEDKKEHLQWLSEQKRSTSEEDKARILESLSQ
jgi:hypothetical protein